MGFSRAGESDDGCGRQPADSEPCAGVSERDAFLVIDESGGVGPFDPRLIANTVRSLSFSQRFGRTWRVSDKTLDRIKIEQDLRRGIDREQFKVYLQPQADVQSNAVVGAEALVRWHHPERGVVLPDEFIPIAEQSGLIVQIGEQVLRAACQQAVRRQRAGGPSVRVAVNLSTVQFREKTLIDAVASALDDAGLDGSMLELEITETTAMSQAALAVHVMHDLTSLGVRLSLDDFGTGYSSLQYLKDFPINALKIDRSFVSGVSAGAKGAAMVATIIAIGHGLGLEIIAEGIETSSQLAFLRERGCDWYQGFLLGRPMSVPAFDSLLTRQAA